MVLAAACGWAELVDGVVATVGPEVILQSDLMREIAPTLNSLRQTAKNEEEFNKQAEVQLEEALNQAIENKILLREALLAGLELKDDMVEQRIAEIKKNFSSNEEFTKELEAAGETLSDFRERVRKQIMAISMGMRKHKQFEEAAEIAEADVAKYYEDNKTKFTHPERVRLRRIFLEAGQDADARAQAKARLEELKKQAANGGDFAELAKTYSMGPEAEKGGLVGWVNRKDLVAELDTAAFALAEGAVSDVLDTEFGCVLLMAEKKEEAGTASLDEVRTKIEPALRAQFADEKYKKWMAELRKRSRVRMFL